MKESSIERKCCNYAQRQGWMTIKISSPGRRGFPDRLMLRQGCYIWVEFKAPGGRLSALQRTRIAELRRAGAEVHVVDNMDKFVEALG